MFESGKKSEYTNQEYSSVEDCLLGHNKIINEQVEIYSNEICKEHHFVTMTALD